MKTAIKKIDTAVQLVFLILILIAGLSLYGWVFLAVLFPALGVLQLLSAAIRTIADFNRSEWHRKLFKTYWVLVAGWIIVNAVFYLIETIQDGWIFSMMLTSMPVAIWYYSKVNKEERVMQEIVETEENGRLAAMMK
jgi:hypothetical protein